jgi:hypothetical protein
MTTLDENIVLGTGELTSLRRLARENRLVLRRSGSYRPQGATEPRKALWADIANPSDPNATKGFDINEADYKELLSMGVPEAPTP